MPCSTACIAASASRPIRTYSLFTRRSPTSSRCSSTSRCRKRCSHQIAATRGDLEKQNLLGQLAVQFGEATGRYGALRDYIGNREVRPSEDRRRARKKPVWVSARQPKRTDYERCDTKPHDRGAVLVAAVFDAFLQIYKRRTADLLRLATGGSGVLPDGDISADLVNRLAHEASKVAGHILNICIRALDYCPPVDLTFGEYLRALITADTDLVPNDKHGYRTAFIEAFRNRGIYPQRRQASFSRQPGLGGAAVAAPTEPM